VQKDGAASQTPFEHRPEQHSWLFPQPLPDVLHPGLSAAHVPFEQAPPQHSPSLLHAAPSLTHCVEEHLKSTHENVQQSGPEPHSSPAIKHAPATREHMPVSGSQ
jgi:hypothetical protein